MRKRGDMALDISMIVVVANFEDDWKCFQEMHMSTSKIQNQIWLALCKLVVPYICVIIKQVSLSHFFNSYFYNILASE